MRRLWWIDLKHSLSLSHAHTYTHTQGEIAPWQEEDIPDCLIPEDQMPEPGSVVSEKRYGGAVAATEYTLSNGMR
jgi:hypothetical protein